jgi:hypothetical protein
LQHARGSPNQTIPRHFNVQGLDGKTRASICWNAKPARHDCPLTSRWIEVLCSKSVVVYFEPKPNQPKKTKKKKKPQSINPTKEQTKTSTKQSLLFELRTTLSALGRATPLLLRLRNFLLEHSQFKRVFSSVWTVLQEWTTSSVCRLCQMKHLTN